MFTNMLPSIKKYLATFAVVMGFVFFFIACGGGSGGGSTPPPPPPPPPASAPTISAIQPNAGTYLGGSQVLVIGTNFVSGVTVTFGNASAAVTNVLSTQITLTTPAYAPGTVDVVVKNPDGQSAKLAAGYIFVQTPQELARSIMGKNYFGVEENQKYFGVTLSSADASYAYNIPYTKDTLLAKKDTHLLVLVTSAVSILDLQAKLPQGTIAFSSSWLASQPFASAKRNASSWFLVRKAPQPGSLGLTENAQYGTFLQGKEDAPDAQMLVYALAGYYLATGEVLMPSVFVRTGTYVNPGSGYLEAVTLGGNAYGGHLGIGQVTSWTADPTIGISSWWSWDGTLVP